MTPSVQTLCPCMIVEDEAPVIRRCLDSVRPLIDAWLVVDTGSTDGTRRIVREHMAGLPGTVVVRPWRDFARNRIEVLALARPRGEEAPVVDADEALAVPKGFLLPALDAFEARSMSTSPASATAARRSSRRRSGHPTRA